MELKKKVMWLIFRRYIMAKKWKLFSERISKIFIFLGLGLLIGIVILYWFNDHDFDYKYQINDNKLGSFGDIIGGLIGSIWALAGYILYYVALKDQRKDIETNQKALVVQVDTLNQQIEEYKLQRDELVQTRKVLNQQSKTFLKQQFESTFFNSLKLLGELIDDLKLKIPITKAIGSQKEPYISYEYYEEVLLGKEIFNIYLERLKEEYLEVIRNNIKLKGLNGANNVIIDEDANIQKEIVKQIALKYFNKNQKELGHYFRTISNVIKLLENNMFKIDDFQFYNDLFMDQFSSEELVLLFYYFIGMELKQAIKIYIEENGYFKNINEELLFSQNHKSLYKDNAYK